ncbi:similar to Saccharomyces cerevisiae YLR231C BNA5 Kynureninase, required for the de novo biosynthesis of NAD from tryptophan via kynurenine [Maudiozyma barnettii]|uniref:Kynureninase n=1 Tax=Maudiozyma barnettii TaxID=61262 RepID=A0A8H2VH96_9SACH|nr:kynureninase [Kazachstania barnettii]CAB4255179.1 similar to Saccharomyces cerevisiae YLR231C BNA5 Kynureninase, required for the de novo biosynthesis of NAD from tryptophan via kynurenine [Kazachstania barnettii]CAD1783450.1 similar to Saccharomyces cerevisiae YLR231C BNA5 Kynureninase, required for the de novo biosynthesis of NAD from tryptophan via kynurenine [Kazachstania barnettii]
MTTNSTLKWEKLDEKFPCESRDEFHIPTYKSLGIPNIPEGKTETSSVNYLCGNSLGLMPKQTKIAINHELQAWAERGVESHFRHPKENGTPWVDIDLPLCPLMASIVGANTEEVAVLNSLTVNLNNMLVSFYKPTPMRYKILFEAGAFPSDCYVFINQCRNHGIDPEDGLIKLRPREGEYTLRTEDILETIEKNCECLALVCLPGIQYYTGQLFDIETITKAVHGYPGIVVGWDLAHAVGNSELKLHHWNVDFAVWCSYKYLNAGPGGIGGIFVHERYHTRGGNNNNNTYLTRQAGWWGNKKEERFLMKDTFDPIPGALGFRQSNPSVLDVVALRVSLEIFEKYGGITQLMKRSLLLTKFLFELLQESPFYYENVPIFEEKAAETGKILGFVVITPCKNDKDHGAQLSLLFLSKGLERPMETIFEIINQQGVIADERKPDVIRLAPAPLYNTFQDVYESVQILNNAMKNVTGY